MGRGTHNSRKGQASRFDTYTDHGQKELLLLEEQSKAEGKGDFRAEKAYRERQGGERILSPSSSKLNWAMSCPNPKRGRGRKNCLHVLGK